MMKALPDPTDGAPALEEPEDSICGACGGMCCSFKKMTISYKCVDDLDATLPLEERVRATIRRSDDLLRQSGKPVDMRWYTNGNRIWFDCQHLTGAGRCGIYEDRPELCRAFECAVLRGRETLTDYKDRFALEPGEREREDGLDSEDDMTEVTDIVNDELANLSE